MIDANTGIVTTAATLDRESLGATRNITVRATSVDGSQTDQVFSISIQDLDEFDVGTLQDTNPISNAVDENVAIGTIVGITAAALDADATNNTMTYSLIDDDGGNFTIDPNTGIVATANALDREALGAVRNITVRAISSDGSFTDQAFSISINDVDEFDTSAISDSDVSANMVNENVPVGSLVGIVAMANDNDATNQTVTYSLVDDDGGRFAIGANSGSSPRRNFSTESCSVRREASPSGRPASMAHSRKRHTKSP